jgi:tRNA pseudouridine38-40 synthase
MTLFDESGPSICRLLVAYDGTGFRGFAPQPDQHTVGGVIAGAVTKVLRHDVELSIAGRTDAGVHGWGQVVSFEAPPGLDPDRLRASLNGMLGPEVVVRAAELVRAGFDARRSASWRHYRYTIVNRPEPDPFLARYAWWIPQPLDLRALRLAADPFVGEHDFASFCRRRSTGVSTTVRRVFDSSWLDLGDGLLRYEVRASAFCWQMVRSIVGTLAEVGLGKRRPGEMLAILRSGDRAVAGPVAPAAGLCLWEVGYDPPFTA